MKCLECNKGKLIFTGKVLTSYPAQHEYKCNHCRNIVRKVISVVKNTHMEKCISCNKMFEIDESIDGSCPDCVVKISYEYNEYLESLKDDSVDLGDEFNEEGDSIWF